MESHLRFKPLLNADNLTVFAVNFFSIMSMWLSKLLKNVIVMSSFSLIKVLFIRKLKMGSLASIWGKRQSWGATALMVVIANGLFSLVGYRYSLVQTTVYIYI